MRTVLSGGDLPQASSKVTETRLCPAGGPHWAGWAAAPAPFVFTSHLRILRELAALPTSVSTDMLHHELGQRPLSHGWWQRLVRFWNSLASLPDANMYKQVALDSCRDAIARNVQNWAMDCASLGMRMLLGVMLCGLCTCLPCSSSWMPLHFRLARDLTYALGRACRPVPRFVQTTGGLLGRSIYAGRGPC